MPKKLKQWGCILLSIALIGGLWPLRGQLLHWGEQATNLSTRWFFTDGLIWSHSSSQPSSLTPVSPLTSSSDNAASSADTSSTPLTPTPPAGVKTGKVQTKTLPLSAANTVAGGVHINNQTGLTLHIEKYLSQGLPFSLDNTGQPQVLIVHTHATECYLDGDYGYYISSASTRSTDNTKNTVAVGARLSQVLNQAGIVTVQATTQHDNPNYTGSYTRSAATIQEYLNKYPTIRVIIDLHRDAIGGGDNVKIKPTATIQGKNAAQVMILAGCETGSVENFPNWQENLRFCLQLQRQLEADYPGLCRPLLFKACKYNFALSSGSILVEVGTDANTLQEALYSATLLGQALSQILSP